MASARTRGQGMTEYILIVGLIAILLVGAVVGLRRSMGSAFGSMTTKLEGVGAAVAAPSLSSGDAFSARSSSGSASLLDTMVDADGDGIDDRLQR